MGKKTFGKKPKELLSVKLVRPATDENPWILFSGGFPVPGRIGIGVLFAVVVIITLFNAPDPVIAKELVAKVFDLVDAIWSLRPTK